MVEWSEQSWEIGWLGSYCTSIFCNCIHVDLFSRFLLESLDFLGLKLRTIIIRMARDIKQSVISSCLLCITFDHWSLVCRHDNYIYNAMYIHCIIQSCIIIVNDDL